MPFRYRAGSLIKSESTLKWSLNIVNCRSTLIALYHMYTILLKPNKNELLQVQVQLNRINDGNCHKVLNLLSSNYQQILSEDANQINLKAPTIPLVDHNIWYCFFDNHILLLSSSDSTVFASWNFNPCEMQILPASLSPPAAAHSWVIRIPWWHGNSKGTSKGEHSPERDRETRKLVLLED